jgi:peptidoglycan-associated lipoprotein
MIKRVSFAALAIATGLAGCATTAEDPQNTTAASPSSSSSSSSPASSGTATRSGVAPGMAVPPGTTRSAGSASAAGPDLKRSVYFEFDKYDVKPEYRALVEANARWLKANPRARLTIEGNADEQGSREYNLALGQKRAESVGKMMTLMGVRSEQVEAISYGEERPRSSGHDEKAWSENRRSDFAQR